MDSVFVYGTLLFPEVLEAVIGWRPASRPARLRGWVRLSLRGRPYPGLLPRDGAETPGLLCRSVDAGALARLDHFEGRSYERIELPVESDDVPTSAWVYVLAASARNLALEEPWAPELFRARHLTAYTAALR